MTEEARTIVGKLRCAETELKEVGATYFEEDDFGSAADLIESLSAHLDAAVRDMGMTAHCVICTHHRCNGGDCCGVSMCGQHRPNWKWRGVEKEVEG